MSSPLRSPLNQRELTQALVSPDPLSRRMAKLLLVSSKQEQRSSPPKRIWFLAVFLVGIFAYQAGTITSWRFGGLVHRTYENPQRPRLTFERSSVSPASLGSPQSPDGSSSAPPASKTSSSSGTGGGGGGGSSKGPPSTSPSDPAHDWVTHQTCHSSPDESEVCTYSGPVCTDGRQVYVGVRDAEWGAWDGAPGTFPPGGGVGLGCWDMRTLELTSKCTYTASSERTVEGTGGGGGTSSASASASTSASTSAYPHSNVDGGAFYWTSPVSERLARGGWGPMGLLSPVVPLHWRHLAEAFHSGQHTLVDPTVHWLPVGREWDKVGTPPVGGEGDVPPAPPAPLLCREEEGGEEGGGRAAVEEEKLEEEEENSAAAPTPKLHLHWLDGALWMTHMSIGWIAHPWHFASAAFPLWTARRRNATALHVPRPRRLNGGAGAGAGVGGPHIGPLTEAEASAESPTLVGGAGGAAGTSVIDDSSFESELVLTVAGGVKVPPMDYLMMLQDPVFDGVDGGSGELQGLLGDETPGRKGRGLADYPVWQRGALSLMMTPRREKGKGVEGGAAAAAGAGAAKEGPPPPRPTTMLTVRTIAETLGVSSKAGGYATQSPPSLFDAQVAASGGCPKTAAGGGGKYGGRGGKRKGSGKGNTSSTTTASTSTTPDLSATSKLPRLMCSMHGAVLPGLQPRLFTGVADAHAFRLAAWDAAGVLSARANALAVSKALQAAAAENGGVPAYPVWRGHWEWDTVRFLRGAKGARGEGRGVPTPPSPSTTGGGGGGGGGGKGTTTPPSPSNIQWWSDYPPRTITVISRTATRSYQPRGPLRALMRHVGLPIRWLEGMGNKGWDEQVALLSSTGILISPHGGDLAGIPFLPPSASIIEAFPYLMDWEGYRHLAEAVGARYQRLAAPPPTAAEEAEDTVGVDKRPHGKGADGATTPTSPTTDGDGFATSPPLKLPTGEAGEMLTTSRAGAYPELFGAPSFEQYCEDPQRVPSLDANTLTACNSRSKNSAVELDWPALVRAVVQALDDIGCRPRQFSARQARAIRAAQAAAGYVDSLWEGWEGLEGVPPPGFQDPFAPPPPATPPQAAVMGPGNATLAAATPGVPDMSWAWERVQGVLEGLGLKASDLSGGGGGGGGGEETWGPGQDVFEWSNADGGSWSGVGTESGGQEHALKSGDIMGEGEGVEGDRRGKKSLPGVALEGVDIRDIHLVPVTGADGWAGERLPFINVRAKCVPPGRQLHDRSPWG